MWNPKEDTQSEGATKDEIDTIEVQQRQQC